MSPVLFNALIDILAAVHPDTLENLREKYPDQAGLLRPGRPLGEADHDPRSAAIVDLMDAAVPATRELLNSCDGRLRRRLDRTRALSLFAHLITLLSSSGVIGALLVGDGTSGRTVALLAAVVAFTASAALLIAERPGYLHETSPTQLFERLYRAAQSLAEIETEWELLRVTKDEETILQLARRANSTAADVRVVDFALGKPRSFRRSAPQSRPGAGPPSPVPRQISTDGRTS